MRPQKRKVLFTNKKKSVKRLNNIVIVVDCRNSRKVLISSIGKGGNYMIFSKLQRLFSLFLSKVFAFFTRYSEFSPRHSERSEESNRAFTHIRLSFKRLVTPFRVTSAFTIKGITFQHSSSSFLTRLFYLFYHYYFTIAVMPSRGF